ncbi:50S ribosomal protein L13 [Sulfobacillus thermosulfidooxidans]|uniref:50S ribosomal protein L13 n=1 Tax=Sulfobacillus thermosulfidooxidans TaxID=28034 RepID=UPI0002FC793F|nr:50S ribosomal protein L13 [Sulfobacillus thermosulfidooxidans]OLZ10914.1 50S ribosomal protein L13 [Sulfobacillus thermosulfidooxidans]OLZ14402.1 50S ribosomal protein L13 [Sulfobacillus thermosulfidooxidans]OLZ19145.1 50S ribosomal protein L13 [Sulfobacillus thermosulfidooxidans]
MSTYMARSQDVQRTWYVIDAAGLPLGRVATAAATILRGKHKPTYTPHVDTGDYVIIVNAANVVLTGRKLDQKIYFHHSGYFGGLKRTVYRQLMKKKPTFAVEKAIRGMLPHNRLGRAMFRKLKVYPNAEHPHSAQQPQVWEVKI